MYNLGNVSMTAFGPLAVGMQVAADNLANMNTQGFKAGRVRYETGPEGQGMRLGEVSRDRSPGPLLPALPSGGAGAAAATEGSSSLREGSNVSVEGEFVNMIATENAYSANAVMVRGYEETCGTLLDMLV